MSEGTICKCGHSDRIHRKGASPRYAGCMSRVDDRPLSRAGCPCNLTPEQVRADLIEGSKP